MTTLTTVISFYCTDGRKFDTIRCQYPPLNSILTYLGIKNDLINLMKNMNRNSRRHSGKICLLCFTSIATCVIGLPILCIFLGNWKKIVPIFIGTIFLINVSFYFYKRINIDTKSSLLDKFNKTCK